MTTHAFDSFHQYWDEYLHYTGEKGQPVNQASLEDWLSNRSEPVPGRDQDLIRIYVAGTWQ